MSARIILYVEDDDAAFHLAKIILDEVDPPVELIRARDGEQALTILRKLAPYESAPTPDVILLDVNLPNKTGFEVLADLKVAEPLCFIPVVMFSTSASLSDKSHSLALGAQGYVVKPLDLDPYVEAVKRVCSFARETPGAAEPRR